ncbi:hypothetical protein LOK49_LG04G02547 [Camellia lanceoleosa]|uniref:Uncharacterized protein n=1 Tax=Camellia lanceoleosa TaxID=1840588 RepID=A0ACC0I1K6_9ERIC|nr:hypothetical protein LOK49_LG04G02547 [Camellia lanceoleosa]
MIPTSESLGLKRNSVENPSQMRRVPEYTDEASDEELADGELFPTVERREFSAKEWRDYMEYQEKQADEAVEVIHKIRADNPMPKSAAARTYRRDA